MFKDEAAILQAAATLAAASHTVSALRESETSRRTGFFRVDIVDRLGQVLRKMESNGLIPTGLAPAEPAPDAKES
jgi:hypothetical protein